MKKFPLIILLLVFFLVRFSWGAGFQAKILNLANALSLWANEHQGKYPDLKQFNSPAFLLYLEKVKGSKTDRSGVSYRVSGRQNSFKLACGDLSFTPSTGLNSRSEISGEDKAAILVLIRELYQAYNEKNLEKILELQGAAIEESARLYQAAGKGSGEEVREAFRECTRELISSPQFKMEDLNLKEINFKKQGSEYLVSSYLPIIFSSRVMVQSSLEKQPVRLRIGEISLLKTEKGFKISKLTLY